MAKYKISVFEFFLLQLVFYALIWLVDDYVGSIASVVMAPVCLAVLIIALIAEALDRSRVPKIFFLYFATAFLAPAIVGLFFAIVYEGKFDWLQN